MVLLTRQQAKVTNYASISVVEFRVGLLSHIHQICSSIFVCTYVVLHMCSYFLPSCSYYAVNVALSSCFSNMYKNIV